jgi:hypothetical protein
MDDAEEKKRLNFEAAEWVKRFNLMKADHGLITASAWWGQTIRDIEKRRGPKAAQELRDAMNRLKK